MVLFFGLALGLGLFGTGCLEKTLLPRAEIHISKVEPADFVASTTTALSQVTITCALENKIYANPVSYSVSYRTNTGQALTSVRLPETPIHGRWESDSVTVVITPFSAQLLDLVKLTPSLITPITATIRLTFRDANDNLIVKEVYCRLL
ncbi:MAG: hypothetical protein OZSIB_0645 [Candidatus Ozemobacter sibiricus]|jgi:hypothetical protein|uniref:Uncharacterized protein n=1 Tax=Candidatus Ozemobacter sibiricus TaxID=2268124 RepID=A0A367ZW03_9BACT|nr:MAG: hypothetical protein OZSIB_0645 [Candidatus Ozemobacter sibiricus]